MAACVCVCVPCTLMHPQESDSQHVQCLANVWHSFDVFFNTAAVHFLRHVNYPRFRLSVSFQRVCSKQHVMRQPMPVQPSSRCGGEHYGHKLRFSLKKRSLKNTHL